MPQSFQEEIFHKLRSKLKAWPGVFLVGGALRDHLLAKDSHDLDLCVESEGGAQKLAQYLFQEFPGVFREPIPLGRGYPIWQLLADSYCLEISDTQKEMFPDAQSRQRISVFGNLQEDCQRRDFTVNMLYWSFESGEILDPSGVGLSDLKQGILRTHPQQSGAKIFSDDPLRILRMLRFSSQFAWKIDSQTWNSAQSQVKRLEILSKERVRDELIKVSERVGLAPFFRNLHFLGALEILFPELLPMLSCEQDRIYHAEGNVWVHTLKVMEEAPASVVLQLAALLHDVGKPKTRTEHGERVKFLNHENISAEMAKEFLEKWKFPKTDRERICKIIQLHLRGGDVQNWKTLKPARKLLRDAGEVLEDLLVLIAADSAASLGPDLKPRLEHIPILHEKLKEAAKIPISKKPLLDGYEIMQELGIGGGPQIRVLQNYLLDLEEDFLLRGESLSRESALEHLRKYHRGL